MIFTPYSDEKKVIETIQSIHNNDYILVRLTDTMIEKNNLDANVFFRELLLKNKLVDYDKLQFGGTNGIKFNSTFIQKNSLENVILKFYRVANKRGDRRFSIETIKRKVADRKLGTGDLLYISTYMFENTLKIFIVNLTNNVPSKEYLKSVLGLDKITIKLNEILPKLKQIVSGGYYANSKGKGKLAPKDIGDTFESLLDIETNNRNDADIDGLIEIKTKGSSNTRDTLFTLRPKFDGTRTEQIEPDDKKRVSAFTRLYGYDSDKHPDYQTLYITIGSEISPQNGQGFYLSVDETHEKVLLNRKKYNSVEITAYWYFEDLKKALYEKHPSTLWVSAIEKFEDGIYKFKYTDVDFTKSPRFMTFITLIKEGIITYDWRGYTTKTGKYSGKNHGNAWRIDSKNRNDLFGEYKKIF